MLKPSTLLATAALSAATACHKTPQHPGALYGIDKEEMVIAGIVLAKAQAFEAIGEKCEVPIHAYKEGPLGERIHYAKYRIDEDNDASHLWPATSRNRDEVAFAAEPSKPSSVFGWSLGTPEFSPSYIVDFDWEVIDAAGEEGWEFEEADNPAYDCVMSEIERLGCRRIKQGVGKLLGGFSNWHNVWACDLTVPNETESN